MSLNNDSSAYFSQKNTVPGRPIPQESDVRAEYQVIPYLRKSCVRKRWMREVLFVAGFEVFCVERVFAKKIAVYEFRQPQHRPKARVLHRVVVQSRGAADVQIPIPKILQLV